MIARHSTLFATIFDDVAAECHGIAVLKGWYQAARNDGELIALCHSELSEALEALRNHNPRSTNIPDFSSVEEELADTVIRIMDMAAVRSYRLGRAIEAKIAFNRTRPQRHGGKLF